MKKDTQRSLPPVIRVFLSSTFADMDKERSYFNEVLVPKINRLCAERGVSFFSVDLRWGITAEEQVDGKVLPICLSEIDKCRPYFIGILGNRYGSVLETVPEKISDMIPWLKGKEGHSITELEMLYAVLEHNDEETLSNCAFYFRSDNLTEQLYGHLKCEDVVSVNNLRNLKQCIAEDPDTPCSEYSSIEEFGSFVMRDILNWLDRHFPESEDIDAIRSEWYNSEILRNHAPNTEFNRFLDSYISESKKPLLIYGDGARGKTASLTAWIPADGHKVLVNCGADDKYSYWPAIVDEVIKQISHIVEGTDDENSKVKVSAIVDNLEKHKSSMWSRKREMFFLTETELENFRRYFLKWFSEFNPTEKITVVINDLNLLDDEKSRFLCWLPSETSANIKLICTSNDDEMVGYSETLGWNNKEMPLLKKEAAGQFIKEYLSTFGKSLSPSQFDRILDSHAAKFPGLLRFIIRFLINYGRFENLDSMITSLSSCLEIQQIYMFIYKYLIRDYSDNEQMIARGVLALVRSSEISLRENECFDLTNKSCEITPIEWANICRAFEQLEIVHGDYWNVQNEETEKFIDALLTEEEMKTAHELLGDFVLKKLHESISEKGLKISPLVGAKCSKAVLHHYLAAGEYSKLESALSDRCILEFLYMPDWSAVRASWMQLFLHTDIDIAEDISSLAREYCSMEKDYENRIGKQLIGLLVDFEFEDRAEELCRELGIDNPGGTIDQHSPGLSDQFIGFYKRIKFLEAKNEYRTLYDFINALLGSGLEFTEMDICQLIFTKSNVEMKLSYFNEALESANEYFRLSLKMGFFFEMENALSMRANNFNRLGRYDEALYINERVISFAYSEGVLRSYLGELNLKAMISYKIQKYDEAIAIFDDLYRYWSKLGNMNELSTIVLNRCNALSYKGDFRAALSSAEEWYSKINGNTDIPSKLVIFLGNMGYYAMECKEYEKAEDYLIKSVAMAKKYGFESTLLISYNSLATLYSLLDNVGKRHEIYSEKMKLLWKRGEYDDLITTLKSQIEELLVLKHKKEADEIEEYWKEKFSTIEGGNEYFEEKIKAESLDSLSIESLEEQLIIAKSEGKSEKIVRCLIDLANALGHSDAVKSVGYLLSATDISLSEGKKDDVNNCIALALRLIIEKGKARDEALLRSVYDRTNDRRMNDLIMLWLSSDSGEGASNLLWKIAGYYSEYAPIVVAALVDLNQYAVDNLSGEELIEIVNSISDEQDRYEVSYYFGQVMLADLQQNESQLIQDYMSSNAEQLIAYFEKCIVYLSVFDKANAAAFAGNIAIIFRRRENKEKTLYYHKLSMEIFSELKKPRDRLIEMTNLATAYGVFGELDKAIDTLREALDYATNVGDHLQRALVADNLADFLRKRENEADKEEILRCFNIGETFFRSSGHTRDLIISIRNQLVYLYDKEPVEVWESKLWEMKELVSKYGFTEFDQSVRFFEWHASNRKKQNSTISLDQAKQKVQKLLDAYYENCSISDESIADGYYKFRALPSDQSAGREEFYFFYDVNQKNTVHVINAYIPAISVKNLEVLREYISWWNGIGEYTLEWEKDDEFIKAHMVIRVSDWEEATFIYKKMQAFWMIDKTVCLAIFSGDFDMVKEFQGIKLKLFG